MTVHTCGVESCDVDPLFDRVGETTGADQVRLADEKLFQSQLTRTYAGSPFLRRKFAEAGLSLDAVRGLADLPLIPFTVKDELRAAQEDAPPFGDYLVADPHDVKRIYQTSGTTGRPSLLALTAVDSKMMTHVGSRTYRALGVHPHHRVLVTSGAGPFIAGHSYLVLENLECGVVPVAPGNTDKVISALRLGLVDSVVLTSSFALYLVDRFAADGLDVANMGLVNVFIGGEPGAGLPEVRKQLEAGFGTPVRELMGIGDVCGALFGECSFGGGMHFNGQGYVYPELIDEQGNVVPIEEGATGELVYTSLVREAMPMIRFRSRDFARITGTSCECGRTGFKMVVSGRLDDMFIVRGVNVYPSAVQAVVADFRPRTTGRCRVVLPKGQQMVSPPVEIKVEVPDGDAGDSQLAAELEAELRARLIFRSLVKLVPASEFGASDYKTRLVVRRD
ncbi:MAG: phenylacetate--CoA ligase family protein [Actinomycetota bacterium]